MGEFDLIARYFTRPVRHAALGVGDDCALLAPRPGMQLAISSDMLVEGRRWHWRCPGSMKPGWLAFPKACWRWPMHTAANWWAVTPRRAR